MGQQNEELLRRIAKLVKQNQDLIEHHERLTKENDKLQAKIENFKSILADMKDKGAKIDESMIDRPRSLKFKMATVLFANIHGFSRIDDEMDSEKLMDALDQVLWQFDEVLKKYNIHKIKTIGDSYMCAGGIPVKNITNPVQVVLAALIVGFTYKQVLKSVTIDVTCSGHAPSSFIAFSFTNKGSICA